MKFLSIFKDPTAGRLRAGWRILGQQILLVFTLMSFEDYLTAPFKRSISQNGSLILDAITGILAFGISVWLAGKWLDHRPFADFGFHLRRGWWIQFGFGMSLGALLMGFIFILEFGFGYVQVIQLGFTVEPNSSLLLALAVMFIHYIGISFTEEILSRGYLLRNLLEGFSSFHRNVTIALAIVFSSILFALPHAGNPNATPASIVLLIVFGVMCAAGVILTGELAIPLGLHLTWNFFQGNIFGFPVSGWEMRGGSLIQIQQHGPVWFTGAAFGPEAGIVGLLAMLLGILLIVLWSRINIQRRENYVKRNPITA
jgi:membrane protease YdiL (CAAX protease family)